MNGVNIAALLNAIGAISEDRSLGYSRFGVKNQWLDGGHSRTTAKHFVALGQEQHSRLRPLVADTDMPLAFGGQERAMDPLEYLLAAIASSVTVTLVWQATERGIYVDAIDTEVDGEIDLGGCLGLRPELRPGFTAIRISVKLDAECSEAELDMLVEQAGRHSPIVDTIGAATQITLTRVQ